MNTNEAIEILEREKYGQLYARHKYLDEAIDHVIEVMKRGQWIPIESAPKDGTRVLLFAGKWILGTSSVPYIGGWSEKWQCFKNELMNDCKPTHWMPLPEPPQERKD